MKIPAVALIDGEHYPAVVADALRELSDRFEFRGALFLGGAEKIREGSAAADTESLYGVPLTIGTDSISGLRAVIAEHEPSVVIDLSDEPVVGYEQRFRLISECLAEGVTYLGSDFQFNPVTADRLSTCPSLSIIGTGKRVGKTAISGHVARILRPMACRQADKSGLVIVAMGRGGPSAPEVVRGAERPLGIEDLVRLSRSGGHAASDCYEDAALSRITTIGCRRCGGGMAGEPFVSNVAEGALVANSLDPAFVVFEGSGAAMPPVGTDARLLVVGAHQPIQHVMGYLGPYRLLTSDAVVVTMAEEPMASMEKVQAIISGAREIKGDLTVIPTVFRPQPAQPIKGRRVALFTTASRTQAPVLQRHLEERFECIVEMVSVNLSDRGSLKADLQCDRMKRVDTFLTEIKAAAIDVVAESAQERGLEVVFVDNIPVEVPPAKPGDLDRLAGHLYGLAGSRFESQVA